MTRHLQFWTVLIAGTIVIFSCNTPNPRQTFSPPDSEDINAIIETVIFQDSIPVTKNSQTKDTIKFNDRGQSLIDFRPLPFCIDLNTDRTTSFDTKEGIFYLLHAYYIPGQTFFNKEDSLYLAFQVDSLKHFRIDKKLAQKLVITTIDEIQKKEQGSRDMLRYYTMTIPLFSLNKNRAHVEATDHCSFLNCRRIEYNLEKKDGKWLIKSTAYQDLIESRPDPTNR